MSFLFFLQFAVLMGVNSALLGSLAFLNQILFLQSKQVLDIKSTVFYFVMIIHRRDEAY